MFSFSFNKDDEELERLISLLPICDLNAREYIHIEDKAARSEERRVGKECRSRWSPYH